MVTMTAPIATERPSHPLLPMPCRVEKVFNDTTDTFTMEIGPAEPGRDFVFAPGQFNMLYVFGVGEVPISISGDPARPQVLVHTTRAVGTVTRAMQRLQPGDMIGVRGPFGNSWPLADAVGHDLLLVIGGLGLAPLRPVIYQVLAERDRFRQVVVLYGARTPEDVLYRAELEAWQASGELTVFVTVDRATEHWQGNVGMVTHLIPRAPFDRRNCLAMVCGPEIMMQFSMQALEQRGIPPQRMFMSMERNMKCGCALCGRCQWGPFFVCRDGPVFCYADVRALFATCVGH